MSDAPKTDLANLIRIDPAAPNRPSSQAGSCQGCLELAVRVERLEAALATQRVVDTTTLSTTACYWTCVGVHAVALFIMYAVEVLLQFGMMGTIGAIATLVAVQVISTRPIHIRTARTLLTTLIVSFAAFLGLFDVQQ